MFPHVQLFLFLILNCIIDNGSAAGFRLFNCFHGGSTSNEESTSNQAAHTSSGGFGEGQTYLDNIFDTIIINNGLAVAPARIPVQDFSNDEDSVLATGTSGIYEGLNTVRRINNAVKTQAHTTGKYHITATIKLDESNLSYKTIGTTNPFMGHFKAVITNSLFQITIGIDYSRSPCRNTIEEVKITNLGDIAVTATGHGHLNDHYSRAISETLDQYKERVGTIITDTMSEILLRSINTFDCQPYRRLMARIA